MNSLLEMDIKFCDICDNYVPAIIVEDENACQYCWDAYGEIN